MSSDDLGVPGTIVSMYARRLRETVPADRRVQLPHDPLQAALNRGNLILDELALNDILHEAGLD